MHLPYLYKLLSQAFVTPDEYPLLIPILVGGTTEAAERAYGKIFAKYLEDETSVFVVSSDFCHWGDRFSYTYYLPGSPSSQPAGYKLKSRDKTPTNPPIHESIARLDKMAMDAIEGGNHQEFLDNLKATGNTVCGRHPIGITMAALEVLQEAKGSGDGHGRFKFVRYERSSDVEEYSDSSVSYASAVAVL
jgi:AmmeMemoRadiSam system protein B